MKFFAIIWKGFQNSVREDNQIKIIKDNQIRSQNMQKRY